jgi:hypothetical protein
MSSSSPANVLKDQSSIISTSSSKKVDNNSLAQQSKDSYNTLIHDNTSISQVQVTTPREPPRPRLHTRRPQLPTGLSI